MDIADKTFTTRCYSCRETFSYNLDEISDHRVEHGLNPIELSPNDPQKYFARCTTCNTFNTVHH